MCSFVVISLTIKEIRLNLDIIHVSQLRSLLESVNYGKFIKSMQQLRGPLDDLLKRGTKFEWPLIIIMRRLSKLKNVQSSDLVLTHYDQKKNNPSNRSFKGRYGSNSYAPFRRCLFISYRYTPPYN